MSTAAGRRAVVTGAGSGLGSELVVELARRGYTVYGTTVSKDEAEALEQATEGDVTVMVCDVTDSDAVRRMAAVVADARNGSGLDLLVNNAATITPGPLEALSVDQLRHEFEVNVFGGFCVVNAFLPQLRQGTPRPRIVQIGSRTASMPMPFNGVCSASKAAADTLADVYRAELHASGIDVTVAVPGGIRTAGFLQMPEQLKRLQDSMSPGHRALYGDALARFASRVEQARAPAMSPRECAELIVDAAQRTPAPVRTAIGVAAERDLTEAAELTDEQRASRMLSVLGSALPGNAADRKGKADA